MSDQNEDKYQRETIANIVSGNAMIVSQVRTQAVVFPEREETPQTPAMILDMRVADKDGDYYQAQFVLSTEVAEYLVTTWAAELAFMEANPIPSE